MTDAKLTDAFPLLEITREQPTSACEAFIAVFRLHHRPDVVIGAATQEELAERWLAITGMHLEADRVQHVVITYWKDSDA